MISFTSTVCGYPAKTIFDCQSPVSAVPPFGKKFSHRCVKTSIPISVMTTAGAFSCLVDLFEEHVDTDYDLKLGSDWVKFCTTSVPDACIQLSDDDTCLVFSSSPFSAVRSRHTS